MVVVVTSGLLDDTEDDWDEGDTGGDGLQSPSAIRSSSSSALRVRQILKHDVDSSCTGSCGDVLLPVGDAGPGLFSDARRDGVGTSSCGLGTRAVAPRIRISFVGVVGTFVCVFARARVCRNVNVGACVCVNE